LIGQVHEYIEVMRTFISKMEDAWKNSKTLSWILVISGMALALWTSISPRSPGVSIGLLALVAGVMSVRPEMHFMEKCAWIILLITFTILEVRAISRNDQENKAVRDQQNREFSDIAKGLKDSVSISQSQYDSTIGHVDGVLKTTQGVAEVAQKALVNITGANSYPYVIPDTETLRKGSAGTPSPANGFTFGVINSGDQILTGLTVGVSKMKANGFADAGFMTPISVPILAPRSRVMLPGFIMRPEADADGIARYFISMAFSYPYSSSSGFSQPR
jgi:hypothetical protein